MMWRFTLRDRFGKLKAQTRSQNLDTYEGALQAIDLYFRGGVYAPYTATWYIGLCTSAMTKAKDDTAARITTSAPSPPTTNNWTESEDYVESNRQLVVFGSVTLDGDNAVCDNIGSPCTFTMNTTGTLIGGFVVSDQTRGGTSGILSSVNSSAGSLAFATSDILSIEITPGIGAPPE